MLIVNFNPAIKPTHKLTFVPNPNYVVDIRPFTTPNDERKQLTLALGRNVETIKRNLAILEAALTPQTYQTLGATFNITHNTARYVTLKLLKVFWTWRIVSSRSALTSIWVARKMPDVWLDAIARVHSWVDDPALSVDDIKVPVSNLQTRKLGC